MYALAIGPLTASALKCGEDNMLRTLQLFFRGLLCLFNAMQQESESILQKTLCCVDNVVNSLPSGNQTW